MARTLPQRLAEAWRAYWNPALPTRDPALAAYFGTGPTASGETVSAYTALNFSAVWAAVNAIAGPIATIPLHHYVRLPNGGKRRYTESRLYGVLHDAFNPEMPASQARRTMTAHVLLWGNAYAEIVRNQLNQVVQLWPIEPHRVQPYREPPTAPLRYRVYQADGRTVTLAAEDVFHLKGLSYNGVQGYSVIAKARESIGAGLAAERFLNTFYRNGSWFGGALQHPKTLGAEGQKNLRESLERRHQGAGQAHNFIILEEGMEWHPTSMPLKDAEFLLTRQFQIEEICRWFDVPPDRLHDLRHATFSNIEQQSINHVVRSLRPWIVEWESEIKVKLIPPLERRQQFAEHLIDGLLRGDIASRYAAYAVGHQNGWLSTNDVREFENLNPIEGGDVYLVQSNMVPMARMNEIIDAQVRPAPPPPAPVAADPEEEPARAARIESIVADLKDEVARRHTEQATTLETHHEALVAKLDALPAPVPPDLSTVARSVEAVGAALDAVATEEASRADALAAQVAGTATALDRLQGTVADLQATTTAVRTRVEAPPPEVEPPADLGPPIQETVQALLVTAQREIVESITARLATTEALRGWQEATIALIAGKLARREIAHAKKRLADPERFEERATAFYARYVEDALAELRPWLGRLGEAPAREAVLRARLETWAADAVATVLASATGDGDGLAGVVRRWEIDREATLTRVLMEALHG